MTKKTITSRGQTMPGNKPKSAEKSSVKRLHKILSAAGVCSLREAERKIALGEVSVNGKMMTHKGASADPGVDIIKVNGKKIETVVAQVYLSTYKPKGYVTTKSDEKGRRTVMDLLPKTLQHLNPVGRLDIMSEGLLLFSNDGLFSQAVTRAGGAVKKVYMVKVRNMPDPRTIKKMVSGLTLEGEKLKAHNVRLREVTGKNAWLEITLTEGKNLHIRRLCSALGHPVLKLKRTAIGPITLGDLKPGESRHVEVATVNKIKKLAAKRK